MKYFFLKIIIKGYIFLIIVLFSVSIYGNTGYYFKVSKEGIYKLRVPEELVHKALYVSFNNYNYKLFIEDDYAYVYCPTKGNYQISSHYKKPKKKFYISPYNIIKEKKYYKYSLPNTLNKTNWFLDIISEKRKFKRTLYKGIPPWERKEYITFKFYNFKNSNIPIVVKIDNTEKHITLKGSGDHSRTFSFFSNRKDVNIEVISFFHEVGLESIWLKAYEDKVILQQNVFEKYKFKKAVQLKEYKGEYVYGYFSNNEFKRVLKNTKFKNLVIQKAKNIIEITQLKKIIYPLNTKSDFLIIYNATTFNKESINSLQLLLKKISPNLQYKFVKAQHIYNKYSLSNPSSRSIKKYLHKISPKYVLLLGNASEKEDEKDLIPTFYYIEDEKSTRVETDYIYTYLSNPSQPKFSIGRLPFKSSSELNLYIKKTLNFLRNKTNRGYSIYDDISVIDNVDVNYTSYEQQSSLKKFFGSETIVPYLNAQNPKTFQFTGHASYTGWSKNKKVDIESMNSITDGNSFILIDLSCWTGTFAYHKKNCFTENLIEMKNRGAVSVISASGYTQIDNYNDITHFFIKKRGGRIGDVLMQMKKQLFKANKVSLDDIHVYNLLGIPTLRY